MKEPKFSFKCFDPIGEHQWFINDKSTNERGLKSYVSMTASQIWSSESDYMNRTPCKCKVWTLPKIISFIECHPANIGFSKDDSGMTDYRTYEIDNYQKVKNRRPILKIFESEVYPLKEIVCPNNDECPLWNGCVIVDIDYKDGDKVSLDLVEMIGLTRKDAYHKIVGLLENSDLKDNFLYGELSNSDGMHFLFYYDVERTYDNWRKCSMLTRERFFDICGNGLSGYDKVLAIDSVYDKSIETDICKNLFLTTKDYVYNVVSGYIDPLRLDVYNDVVAVRRKAYSRSNKRADGTNEYDILSTHFASIYDTHYIDRFKVATAIKAVTNSKEEWETVYRGLCEQFREYDGNRHYTTDYFKVEFDYDSLDSEKCNVGILKSYGFSIAHNEEPTLFEYNLGENEYLSKCIEDIIGHCADGINLLIAPTGVGKNQTWINYNNDVLGDPLRFASTKPILIVEPLNSISDTKFDDKVNKVTRSNHFKKVISDYGLYVTNYNKLVSKDEMGCYIVKPNISEFLSQFGFIIIDESHIMIKDSYRADVLIPFIEGLNVSAPTCKIILQTATELDESMIFDIKKKFIVHKEPKRKCSFIFRRYMSTACPIFTIQSIKDITDFYINAGRKVYIYWNNASSVQLEEFRTTYKNPERVAIFHKRYEGTDKVKEDESMSWIKNEHRLGDKYDILLSSVYFGVGNDLNDDCKCAVIIIGNNTYAEDVQAIGRWRNSPDIAVCEVVTNDREYGFLSTTQDFDRNYYYNKYYNEYSRLYHDMTIKDCSVLIGGKSYQITTPNDVHKLAVMKSSEEYYSTFNAKKQMFQDYFIDFKEKGDLSKKLDWDESTIELSKEYYKGISETRTDIKKDIINGNKDVEKIKKDSNIEKFNHLWNKIKDYGLVDLVGDKYLSSTRNYNALNIWHKFFRSINDNNVDWGELYALLWYRQRVSGLTDKEINHVKTITIGKEKFKVALWRYYALLSYVAFYITRNKIGYNPTTLFGEYYRTFEWYCRLFAGMPQPLIDKFFVDNEVDFTNLQYVGGKVDIDGMFVRSIEDMERNIKSIGTPNVNFYLHCLNIISGNKKVQQYIATTDIENRKHEVVIHKGDIFDGIADIATVADISIRTAKMWIANNDLIPYEDTKVVYYVFEFDYYQEDKLVIGIGEMFKSYDEIEQKGMTLPYIKKCIHNGSISIRKM